MENKSHRERKEELKHRLHHYRDILAELDQLIVKIQQIESRMKSPRGSNLDGMPKAQGAGNPIPDMVSKHLELIELYRAKMGDLLAAAGEVERLIDRLEPRARRLMRLRYIEGKTWEEICVAIGYSWRQTHNIHAKALNAILDHEQKENTSYAQD